MSKTISNQQVVIVRLDRTIQVLNKAWIPPVKPEDDETLLYSEIRFEV